MSALGFSYGGWTALSLAGMRGNLAALDAGQWNGDCQAGRITKVVAIDPSLTYGLNFADTQNVQTDTLLIQPGRGADRLDSTDLSAKGSGFAALVPAAHRLEIAPTYYFSMLPLCAENGAAILKSENDDPVCTAPFAPTRWRKPHGHSQASDCGHKGAFGVEIAPIHPGAGRYLPILPAPITRLRAGLCRGAFSLYKIFKAEGGRFVPQQPRKCWAQTRSKNKSAAR